MESGIDTFVHVCSYDSLNILYLSITLINAFHCFRTNFMVSKQSELLAQSKVGMDEAVPIGYRTCITVLNCFELNMNAVIKK